MSEHRNETTIAEALATHIESSPLPAVGLDERGRIVAMSRAYRRLAAQSEALDTAQDAACRGCGAFDHMRVVVSSVDHGAVTSDERADVHSVIVCQPEALNVAFANHTRPYIVSVSWAPDRRILKTSGITSPAWARSISVGGDLTRFVDDSLASATACAIKSLTPRRPTFTGRGKVRHPDGRPVWIVHHTTASFVGEQVSELTTIVLDAMNVLRPDGEAAGEVLYALSAARQEETTILSLDGETLWSSAAHRDGIAIGLTIPALDTLDLHSGLTLPAAHLDLTRLIDELAAGEPWRERRVLLEYNHEAGSKQTYRVLGVRCQRSDDDDVIVLHAEHVTSTRSQAIFEFEEQLRSLMSESEEFVLLAGRDGHLRFCSDNFETVLGASTTGAPLSEMLVADDVANGRAQRGPDLADLASQIRRLSVLDRAKLLSELVKESNDT